MKKELTIQECADHFNVTYMAVTHWINAYKIPTRIQRVIGVRARKVLTLEDVYKYSGIEK